MARLMIVDDAAFMRSMLKSIVTEMGHEVVAEASNGKEACAMYSFAKPDLVTMDITMPEMDGVEAVKRMRQIDPGAKILMCSAMGQHTMVTQAFKAGAMDFIVKPFQKDRVMVAIINLLNRDARNSG